jgi:phage recombination protein Bet
MTTIYDLMRDTERAKALVEKSHDLAQELGQPNLFNDPAPLMPAGADFIVRSHSRLNTAYPMVCTPEGIAVHFGGGCEGEVFNGPTGCWHSKEYSMTTTRELATTSSAMSPVAIDFNAEQLEVIKSTIAKGATDTELQLFVATCRRTGLDPFLKQIYAVKRYDSKEKRDVMAIQVGIDGLRLIAERTDRYAGQDPIEWLDGDGTWSEVWTGPTKEYPYPVAARCAVYRKDWPSHKSTAIARWSSYAQYFGADQKLGSMWSKMPDVMLGKCAESLALRRAFPAEMSGLAAAVGSDYDVESDVEMQAASVERLPEESSEELADVIDASAQVVEDVPLATDEQKAAIAEWHEVIKQNLGDKALGDVTKKAKERYPYAVEANRFYSARLTTEDAGAHIAFLKEWHDNPPVGTQATLGTT